MHWQSLRVSTNLCRHPNRQKVNAHQRLSFEAQEPAKASRLSKTRRGKCTHQLLAERPARGGQLFEALRASNEHAKELDDSEQPWPCSAAAHTSACSRPRPSPHCAQAVPLLRRRCRDDSAVTPLSTGSSPMTSPWRESTRRRLDNGALSRGCSNVQLQPHGEAGSLGRSFSGG